MKRRRIEPIYTNTYQQLRNRSRRFRYFLIALILILLVGGWFGYRHYQQNKMHQFPVRGVSLTQSNGFVDFQQLQHQGYQFAYLRATSGATYTDDEFQSNYDRSQGTNLEMGVYHVYSYSTSAKAQYRNFIQEVGQRHGQLPIAVQVTTYGSYTADYLKRTKAQQQLQAFISLIKDHYQKRVIIWCSQPVWRVLAQTPLGRDQHWLQASLLNRQSQKTRFIEYDDGAAVKLNGQSQTVAASVFNGSQKQWNAWVTE
ncbi:GH25 family lysozyme [Secundilactobacillus folii]|uniref:Lyzozyme M1 (1,4-beta-N-acetylmuramidase) n=1 Tax=Secundilactobacillus folii TaxID=2678357 RepID=A0A7X2XUL1_9LACO|nr:GH25 family lysozyme [Secundilactobacillus folii]MTV81968.1 Lyzozyme M1 (1,4-beta-N-acetylmuramidase) [Secundilactobacillus folii]